MRSTVCVCVCQVHALVVLSKVEVVQESFEDTSRSVIKTRNLGETFRVFAFVCVCVCVWLQV